MEDKNGKITEPYHSPLPGSQKMSSSLKERLKRCSRSFSSPVSRIHSPQNQTNLNITNLHYDENSEEISLLSKEDIEACNDQDLLQKMHLNLKKHFSDNEEKLRKLELVQHYHLKNKPDELVILIEKWLSTAQKSLRKLYEKLPENKGEFQILLNMLNIDGNIIEYDVESDTFC